MADKPYLGLENVRKMPDKTERCNDRQATKKVSHFGLFFSMSTFIIRVVQFSTKICTNYIKHGTSSFSNIIICRCLAYHKYKFIFRERKKWI